MNGPEFLLRRDPEILGFEIAKAHHAAEESVAARAVIRVQAVDTGLDVNPFRQLRLDREEFILEPAARSGADESLIVVLQDDPKLLTVQSAIGGRVAERQFHGQRTVRDLAALMNRNWDPALDATRAETTLVQPESL